MRADSFQQSSCGGELPICPDLRSTQISKTKISPAQITCWGLPRDPSKEPTSAIDIPETSEHIIGYRGKLIINAKDTPYSCLH